MVFDHHDLSPELYLAKFGGGRTIVRSLKAAERVGFALADVVLATNESFREIAIDRGRKGPEDVFVVRNGPDAEVFMPTEPDDAVRELGQHVIGYVGLIGSQDGVEDALEALALLRARRADWHAIFVGDGDAVPAAKDTSSRLGLDEHVSFMGYVSDRERIVRLIASCDVCISPEPRNPLNEKSTLMKVAEYMAVGRPVVAFDLTETRRTAGDAATYAQRDDPAAFADAISRLLDDPAERARMGSMGRSRAVESLSWRTSEDALLAAYDRALELGHRRQRARTRHVRQAPV
jgi:glycosyltransferase involved in cell wall biosynthesis